MNCTRGRAISYTNYITYTYTTYTCTTLRYDTKKQLKEIRNYLQYDTIATKNFYFLFYF